MHLADLGAARRLRFRVRLLGFRAPPAHELARLEQGAHRLHPGPDALVVGLLGEVGVEVFQRDQQLAAPHRPLGLLLQLGRRHRENSTKDPSGREQWLRGGKEPVRPALQGELLQALDGAGKPGCESQRA